MSRRQPSLSAVFRFHPRLRRRTRWHSPVQRGRRPLSLRCYAFERSIRVGRAGGITIIDRALSSGTIHPRTNSITTARGHPRRLATCNPACHDGHQFWQAAGTSTEKLTIVSVAVVLERLFGAALSKYCRPDVAVRPVQRTIRIRIDRHAGGFPLLSVRRLSGETGR